MYYATSDEMAHLDKLVVESGLEIRQMMELAGWHMLELFKRAKIAVGSSVAIVVGKGNKGGDGLSAARHLTNHGYKVSVYLLDDNISPDALHHLNLLKQMNLLIVTFDGHSFDDFDVVIDSLIGYRLDGAPRDNYATAVKAINQSGAITIAYDLPTGIDTTSGDTVGEAVSVDYTLMLALPKKALQNTNNVENFGKVLIADIGIPTYFYDQIKQASRPEFGVNGLTYITE